MAGSNRRDSSMLRPTIRHPSEPRERRKGVPGTLGYRDRHSPHSWRSAFSTLADDAGLDHMAIELQLGGFLGLGGGIFKGIPGTKTTRKVWNGHPVIRAGVFVNHCQLSHFFHTLNPPDHPGQPVAQ